MSLLWIIVGLTVIAVGLLILNVYLFKKHRRQARLRKAIADATREEIFERNCKTYRLSTREVDVLRLILAGHTYRSAAEILFISEKTVDAHLRSIYFKTNVRNKVELINRFYS
ncbi:MAG TPA: helix-turn-helix transcriptional regulator [Mucilaginibacter sp.]